jgi:hypothetical protein
MIPTIATGRPKYKRMIRLAALSNPPRHLHVYLALLSRSLRTPIPPTSRTLNLIGIDSDRKRLDAARRYRGNRLPDARRRSVQENSQGTELNQTRMRIRSPATSERTPRPTHGRSGPVALRPCGAWGISTRAVDWYRLWGLNSPFRPLLHPRYFLVLWPSQMQ